MAKGADNARSIGTGTFLNPLDKKILKEALTSHTKAIREEEIQFILKRLEANEYQTSDELREESESEYWLEYEEALEMAYDNQHYQVDHIKGVLRKRLQALNKQ